jgi:hypothetical protein
MVAMVVGRRVMRRCDMKDKQKKTQQDQKVLANQPEELSAIWQELLGHNPSSLAQEDSDDSNQVLSSEKGIPTLEYDPWSTLLQAKGVESLHEAHLQISPQEVEQMLQVMQEQSTQQDDENSSSR